MSTNNQPANVWLKLLSVNATSFFKTLKGQIYYLRYQEVQRVYPKLPRSQFGSQIFLIGDINVT